MLLQIKQQEPRRRLGHKQYVCKLNELLAHKVGRHVAHGAGPIPLPGTLPWKV